MNWTSSAYTMAHHQSLDTSQYSRASNLAHESTAQHGPHVCSIHTSHHPSSTLGRPSPSPCLTNLNSKNGLRQERYDNRTLPHIHLHRHRLPHPSSCRNHLTRPSPPLPKFRHQISISNSAAHLSRTYAAYNRKLASIPDRRTCNACKQSGESKRSVGRDRYGQYVQDDIAKVLGAGYRGDEGAKL